MNLDMFFMKLASFIKAALRALCTVIGVIGILFVLRNLVNALFLYNYGHGTYPTISEFTMSYLPFEERYVIYYNLGNAEYRKQNYDKAVLYYWQALNGDLPEHVETSAEHTANSPVNDEECKIRLNLALSLCHTIDFDHLDTTDEEAVMQAIDVLLLARGVLTEHGCASEPVGSNDGHYHNADKLKHDIDKLLQQLMPDSNSDSSDGGGGGQDEDRSEDRSEDQKDDQNRDENSDNSQSQGADKEQAQKEQARQENLKEELKEQKENLKTGSESPSYYEYEYIDGGDAQGYGDGTLW